MELLKMNDFETALVSPGKNSLIPEEDNWFGPSSEPGILNGLTGTARSMNAT